MLITVISIFAFMIFIAVIMFTTFYRDITKFSLDNEIKEPAKVINPEYADKDDPYVLPFIIPGVLNRIQCNQLIWYAMDVLESKGVPDGRYVENKHSAQIWISRNNPIVKDLINRLAKKLYISPDNAEDPEIVRYLPYKTYTEHYDSCCDDNDKCRDFIKEGGQRKLAVIVYLNQDFEGGETYFKLLDMKFRPDEGGAVVSYPLAQHSNKCHPNSLHSSLQVDKNDKFALHIFFREDKITSV